MERINTKCLDTLKFFAAFIVAVFAHYYHFIGRNPPPFESECKWLFTHGWLMVELFFMLSGFGMYLGYADRIQERRITFKKFILKRLRKIYPLFVLTLLLVVVFEVWHINLTESTFVYQNFDLWHFFSNLILCQTGVFGVGYSFNAPSWCITIFFLMYIIFYIVMYYSKKKEKALCVYACLFFLASWIMIEGLSYPFILNAFFARGLASFSVGILLGYIYGLSHRLNTLLIGYLSLIILLIYTVLYNFDHVYIGYVRLLFIVVIFPAVICSVLYIPWLNRLMSFEPLARLGSLSLGIYLFHYIIQCAISDINIAFGLQLLYSRKHMLVIYSLLVVAIPAVYEKFFAAKVIALVERTAKAFLKRKVPRTEQVVD